MARIAGVERGGKREQVQQMLDKIAHRGRAGSKIIMSHSATLGAVLTKAEAGPVAPTLQRRAVWDGPAPPLPEPGSLEHHVQPFALGAARSDGLFLARDPLGVRPLYYGRTNDGILCFASEVKALLEVTRNVEEFPPGSRYDSQNGFQTFFQLERGPDLKENAARVIPALRLRLEQAVCRQVGSSVVGCWLSGGLGSSTVAALVKPHVQKLHTFAAGADAAPNLERARQVASHLNAKHHEVIVGLDDLQAILPEVIFHLESFDAPLVRPAITNYLMSRLATDAVSEVFSGEGADELLGGHAQIKKAKSKKPSDHRVNTMRQLHNTTLQQVDRSASAHGLVVNLPFLDPTVVKFALYVFQSVTNYSAAKTLLRRGSYAGFSTACFLRRLCGWVGPGTGRGPPSAECWQNMRNSRYQTTSTVGNAPCPMDGYSATRKS